MRRRKNILSKRRCGGKVSTVRCIIDEAVRTLTIGEGTFGRGLCKFCAPECGLVKFCAILGAESQLANKVVQFRRRTTWPGEKWPMNQWFDSVSDSANLSFCKARCGDACMSVCEREIASRGDSLTASWLPIGLVRAGLYYLVIVLLGGNRQCHTGRVPFWPPQTQQWHFSPLWTVECRATASCGTGKPKARRC